MVLRSHHGLLIALGLVACGGAPKADSAAQGRSKVAARSVEAGAAPVASPLPRDAGAPLEASRISGEDLAVDVATLRRAFESLHPGLYRYNTPAEIGLAWDALAASLAGGATLEETFLALSVFTAKIRCGHTYPNPLNQTEATQRALFDKPRLPFHFRWLDGKMIVTDGDASDVRLDRGTEIVAIDGTSSADILARVRTVARADGANDAKRVAMMERKGHERFEPFDIAFSLFFPHDGDRFTLDLAAPDGTRSRVQVRGVRAADERKEKPKAAAREGGAKAPAEDPPLWSLRMIDERVGYLAMPTWVTYDTKWDYKADLARIAEELRARGATALIVDLRGNEGGTDVGNELLAHLIRASLHVGGLARFTRYRSVAPELRPFLHTWDKSFFDWGAAAVPDRDGFFRLTKFDDDRDGDVIAPRAPFLRTKLVVLSDGENSSATFQFEELVQRHHLGTLVGEPTGGNRRGINGGAFFFLSLPKSGLEVDLPLIARFPREGDRNALPDSGLVPDVLVRTTPADVAAGRDPALEQALRTARL